MPKFLFRNKLQKKIYTYKYNFMYKTKVLYIKGTNNQNKV